MPACLHSQLSSDRPSRRGAMARRPRDFGLPQPPTLVLMLVAVIASMLDVALAYAQPPSNSPAPLPSNHAEDRAEVTTETSNAKVTASLGTEPLIAGFARFHADQPTNTPRAGRLLASELSCTACHASADPWLEPKRGPTLEGIASRVDLAWVRNFLRQPHQIKPGTTMPDLFAEETPENREKQIGALIHFLASLPEKPEHFQLKLPPLTIVHPQFWERGNAVRGRALYHQVGCVACHTPDEEGAELSPARGPEQLRQLRELGLDEDEIAELLAEMLPDQAPSVPLPQLASKYSLRSLAFFLLDPLATRPAGRMPHLNLTPSESADLATYLLQQDVSGSHPHSTSPLPLPTADSSMHNIPTSNKVPIDEALVETGRRLFQSIGCVNCHPLPGSEPQSDFPPWDRLSASTSGHCRTQSDSNFVPFYPLSVRQKSALNHLLASDRVSEPDKEEKEGGEVENGSPIAERSSARIAEQLDLTLEKLNCLACHRRDGRGGVGSDRWGYFETIDHVDLGDEGRIPPPLDRVGWKLTTSWLTRLLAEGEKVRPHMLARMPRFGPANVEPLPRLLAVVDQPSPPAGLSHTEDTAASENIEIGRRLLDVGCIQCHPLHGERLPGVIGIDLGGIHGRIQRDWFFAFVQDPAAWKERTRMPTFFPGGVSNSPELAGGDVSRQLASLWDYLQATEPVSLPDRLAAERLHNFEIVPQNDPIVLRTFMKEVGTHAIAVGFPGQLSLAFDSWISRPVIAWKGPFLDAHPIWFDRFTPPTPPLGEPIIAFAPGPLLARLPTADTPWPEQPISPHSGDWKGYHLDEKRIPTFRYLVKRHLIQDRFEPLESGEGFRRRIIVEPADAVAHSAEREKYPARKGESLWCRLHAGTMLRLASDEGVSEVVDSRGLRVRLVNPRPTERQLRIRAITPGENAQQASETSDTPAAEEVKYEWILRLPGPDSLEVRSLPRPRPSETPSAEPFVLEIEYRW
jgi:mono/diheme cytochrome c family protein